MSRKKNRIFFSAKGSELLHSWCAEHDIGLIDFSLIAFSPVEAVPVSVPDIIFYSSPRSVEFSSKIRSAFPGALSATIGKSTSSKLRTEGKEAHFTGETAGDPKKVAEAFRKWAGNRRVLFPISDRSLGSISKAIPAGQREELVVYRTELLGETLDPVPPCDFYLFTSPSNWESFLQKNEPSGTIIAWGNSTASAIGRTSSYTSLVLENPDESALIELLEELIK